MNNPRTGWVSPEGSKWPPYLIWRFNIHESPSLKFSVLSHFIAAHLTFNSSCSADRLFGSCTWTFSDVGLQQEQTSEIRATSLPIHLTVLSFILVPSDICRLVSFFPFTSKISVGDCFYVLYWTEFKITTSVYNTQHWHCLENSLDNGYVQRVWEMERE